MDVSVMVRSKEEADRLTLTLAALAAQDRQAEDVVVNDRSTDHAQHARFAARPMLVSFWVDHAAPRGRAAANNVGAAIANGNVLHFPHRDVLTVPDLVARHLAPNAGKAGLLGRGRLGACVETGAFSIPRQERRWRGDANPASIMSKTEWRASLITLPTIMDDFGSIEARGWMERFIGVHPVLAVALQRVLAPALPTRPISPKALASRCLPQLAAAALIPCGLSAEEVVDEHLRISTLSDAKGGDKRVLNPATHVAAWFARVCRQPHVISSPTSEPEAAPAALLDLQAAPQVDRPIFDVIQEKVLPIGLSPRPVALGRVREA